MTKEERKIYHRAWYLANKEKIKAKNKEYRKSEIDGHYTVYYLPEEHYIGVTTRLKRRMYSHKNNKRHVLDCEIVATFTTKKEAYICERYMHSIGYNGAQQLLAYY